MTAGIHPVLIGIMAYFAVFIFAMAYGQWTTRGMEVHRTTVE